MVAVISLILNGDYNSLGDINYDGVLNVMDVVLIVSLILFHTVVQKLNSSHTVTLYSILEIYLFVLWPPANNASTQNSTKIRFTTVEEARCVKKSSI